MNKIILLLSLICPLLLTACEGFDPTTTKYTGTYVNSDGRVDHVSLYDNHKNLTYRDSRGIYRKVNLLEGSDEYGNSYYCYRFDNGKTWLYPTVVVTYRSAAGDTWDVKFGPKQCVPLRLRESITRVMYYADISRLPQFVGY